MASGPMPTVVRTLRRLAVASAGDALTDRELLDRFARRREEAAFEAVVRRHGPMVFGACRRLLRDRHEAEDVFQATFLVLARKAATGRWAASVGPWLYEVASRLATKSRGAAARRHVDPARLETRRPPETFGDVSAREVRSVLDEELGRLPERLRAPLVLCYLEGKSAGEAAASLGWRKTTLKGRLAQARDLLRGRLVRRGLAPAAALGAFAGAGQAPAAPPTLCASTIRLAVLLAAAEASAVPGLSAPVARLVEGTLASLVASRLRNGALLLLALGLLAAGAGAVAHPSRGEKSQRPADEAKTFPPQEIPTPRVDASGDPLPDEAIAWLGTTRLRHGDYVSALAFSPDGKALLATAGDGVVTWDPATGKELRRIAPPAGQRFQAAVAPDGTFVTAVGSTLALRDGATGRLTREFGNAPYRNLCFSPDGKTLAATGFGTTVETWDVAGGTKWTSWEGDKERVWQLAFADGGKTVATAGNDGFVRFWDRRTGRQVRQIDAGPGAVGRMAFSPDGTVLATVGAEKWENKPITVGQQRHDRVRLWDAAAGKELRQLEAPKEKNARGSSGLVALAFAPDGKSLFMGSDARLRQWDVATGKEGRNFGPRTAGATALAVSPDGKTLAAAVSGRELRLIDLAEGTERATATGHVADVYAVSLTPDGRTAVTTGRDETLIVWDLATGRERSRRAADGSLLYRARVVGDGRTLVTAGHDRTVRVLDLVTGKERRRFEAGVHGVGLLGVSPDGTRLALSEGDGAVVVRELETGKEVRRVTAERRWASGAAFTPDGGRLIVWYDDHAARVWDLATGRQVKQIALGEEKDGLRVLPNGNTFSMSYTADVSPDGRLIAYGNPRQYLTVQDVATGKTLRRLDKLPDGVGRIVFAPDGRTLAWGGSHDPTIHLVELATGQERHHFAGHRGGTWALTFSADGRLLVSGNADTTALVWDLTGRRSAKEGVNKTLSPKELDALWDDLGSADAARGFRAVRALAVASEQATVSLGRRLRPVVVADEKRLARLLADLDGEQFEARESAAAELEKLGETALPAYRKALQGRPSAELRRRVQALLEQHEPREEALLPSARLRELRALEILELIGTTEARRVLETLAKGMSEAWLTREANAALSRRKRTSGP